MVDSGVLGPFQDIQLYGPSILAEHCVFENSSGMVRLLPFSDEATCYVNGRLIKEPTELHSGSRVILAKSHVFRFNNPSQPQRKVQEGEGAAVVNSDWNFAQIELLEKQGVDLKQEMEKRLVMLEEQYKREKVEADILFEQQRKVRPSAFISESMSMIMSIISYF